jgi:imidazolonepropionase
MRILFKNIKELIQVRPKTISRIEGAEMKILPTIKNAYLFVEEGRIADFGVMSNCPEITADEVVDASDKMILPAWCDSHTHLVYAGNREGEFIDRIQGLSYEEIAQKGGGILNSAKKLQECSEEALFQQSKERLEEVMYWGTGSIEIKSGYGLTPEAELKILRVIQRLDECYPLTVKATFLAAHALPKSFQGNRSAFLKTMIENVLPRIAQQNLASFIDVFCEKDYFSVAEMEQLLDAASTYGLVPKVHVNQFTAMGGIDAAVRHHARSVDHLEVLEPEDIKVLQNTKTIPVALPACSYFLGIPYTAARKLLDAGLSLALASDYNPGSAPSGNMNFVISTACIKMKMTPEEAINAATLNGAYAMGLEEEVGSITVGKQAHLILTQPINSYGILPYAFGSDLIEQVYVKGEKVRS